MRRLLAIVSTLAALAVALIAAPAQGGDSMTPADMAIAAKGGWWNADVAGYSGGAAFGVELSANDPFVLLPAGRLRHMWSYDHSDSDGLRLDSAEWNLHWIFPTGSGLWLGAGPGVGYVWSDGRHDGDGVAAQFGVSATWFSGHALLGLESRYQWTESGGADNWLTMAKIGFVF